MIPRGSDRLSIPRQIPPPEWAGYHSFGQRKAAGTTSLTQAFAPSVAGIGAAGYGHAVELHLAGGRKNQHCEDDLGVDGRRAD